MLLVLFPYQNIQIIEILSSKCRVFQVLGFAALGTDKLHNVLFMNDMVKMQTDTLLAEATLTIQHGDHLKYNSDVR